MTALPAPAPSTDRSRAEQIAVQVLADVLPRRFSIASITSAVHAAMLVHQDLATAVDTAQSELVRRARRLRAARRDATDASQVVIIDCSTRQSSGRFVAPCAEPSLS